MRIFSRRALVLLLSLGFFFWVASGTKSQAQTQVQSHDNQWPEFRGPAQNGHATGSKGTPTTWTPRKNVHWKAELPGRAWSSPIIVGDKIFMTNAVTGGGGQAALVADDCSLRVVALSATDGKVLWDVEVFHVSQPQSQGMHQKNSYASATPVYRDGRIYAHFGHFGTACLDEQGQVVWKNDAIKYSPVHGNGGCPVLVDDLLVFMADGGKEPFIAALDIADGALRWKQPRSFGARRAFSFSTPLLVETSSGKQLICPGSDGVAAIEPATGKEIWRVKYEGYSVVPRPVHAHGHIYLSTGYDKAKLLAIREGGQGDVTDSHITWTMGRGAPLTPSPLVIGDEIYLIADNGMMTCADAKTGDIHWQERVARQTSSSPIYADGKIYFIDEAGVSYVVSAGKKFELLGKNDLEDKALASIVPLGGNQLLVRTEKALWCIGE